MSHELKNKPAHEVDEEPRQPATDKERNAREPTDVVEEDDEAERAAQLAQRTDHYLRVSTSVDKILEPEPDLEVTRGLPIEEQRALELLYQARTGENETGNYADGLECMDYLNKALAVLAPVLAVGGMEVQPEQIQETHREIKEDIAALRYDITQRILQETGATAGRTRFKRKVGKKGDDDDDDNIDAERSELGSLAWELAQLVKRRKKKKVPFDPVANPVVPVLESLAATARELGVHCSRLAKIDERRTSELDSEQRTELAQDWAAAMVPLRQAVEGFAARCRPGASADDPGGYSTLAELFADVAGAPLGDDAAVLGAAGSIIANIDACMADADAIVTAEAGGAEPDKKRGVLASLFGRRKKS